jgi:precorrin-3B synthase
MNAPAIAVARRRGACPGLSAPMPTGDGLLVRLQPIGTISLAAFVGLCAAARRYGNGVIEVTSRGSIQVRGLRDASAPQFAADVAALAIAAADGVAVLCSPLAGIDATEAFDAAAIAAGLRGTLARTSLASQLGAKVSVVIDGGGAQHPAQLPADIRLCAAMAHGTIAIHVAIGGDEVGATSLGVVTPGNAIEAAIRLLQALARRGRDVRARDLIAAEGTVVFHDAVADLLIGDALPRPARRPIEAIGLYRLHDGSFACGVGLAFGHADATSLERLVAAAGAAGASGIRTAPDRTLLAIGLTPQNAAVFAAAAAQLGFVARPDDPRRRVVACAGAPVCASAHIAARAIAPTVAAAAAPYLGPAFTIHISGCAKGCAHAAPAALTAVGTPDGCALVAGGSAHDAPFTTVPADELAPASAHFARERKREARHV